MSLLSTRVDELTNNEANTKWTKDVSGLATGKNSNV